MGQMYPAKWYFRKHEEEPTTEVAIRRSFSEDVYIVLAGFDMQNQSASFHVVVNPLVNWVWAGFGILALGTLIALLPEQSFAYALARVPAGAATTSLLLLSFLLLPTVARAQHVESPQYAAAIAKTPLARELGREIICMCGDGKTCGRKLVGECSCGLAAQMRGEIERLVSEGKTRDEVYEFYMAKYGSQQPLASPIDKGFNRLAWLLPYMLGAVGAVCAVVSAIRWSRQSPSGGTTASRQSADQELERRLDDELRDLD